jgi:CheY-like chemotaxis protein
MPFANRQRVLIADDDADTLAAYAMFFEAHGFNTRAAEDGADALAVYCSWHPDVVVLDIQMPVLDGREVAREIRRLQAQPAPLLVAVTSLSSPSEAAESIRSGFDHHLVKPAPLPVILAAIMSHPRVSDDNAS